MPCRTSGHATATSASRLPDRNWLCLAQRSLGSGPASGHEVRATPRVAATSASLPRAEAFARLARTARSENWLRFSRRPRFSPENAANWVRLSFLAPSPRRQKLLRLCRRKRPLADGGRIAAHRPAQILAWFPTSTPFSAEKPAYWLCLSSQAPQRRRQDPLSTSRRFADHPAGRAVPADSPCRPIGFV